MADTVEQGWRILFDGNSKNGWHIYNSISDGTAWKIADGALYLNNSQKEDGMILGGGDLTTDDQFEEFHLKLEWKIAAGGNSGILFHVKEDPAIQRSWHTGLEMQLLDNDLHKDGAIETHRAGDLYDLVSATEVYLNRPGNWNLAEIILRNGNLQFCMNEKAIMQIQLWSDLWFDLLANSKFKDFPGYGIQKRGHIVLQDHGDEVWFRNILIKEF